MCFYFYMTIILVNGSINGNARTLKMLELC